MRLQHRSFRKQTGFTLLEIMVVVAIIAILSTVVVINIAGNVDEARLSRAKQDIQSLSTALQLYRNDNASYPSTQQGLDALLARPSGNPPAPNWKPYLSKLPLDPWNNPYQYLQPGQRGEFDVWSMGPDGRSGGEGKGADIGSW